MASKNKFKEGETIFVTLEDQPDNKIETVITKIKESRIDPGFFYITSEDVRDFTISSKEINDLEEGNDITIDNLGSVILVSSVIDIDEDVLYYIVINDKNSDIGLVQLSNSFKSENEANRNLSKYKSIGDNEPIVLSDFELIYDFNYKPVVIKEKQITVEEVVKGIEESKKPITSDYNYFIIDSDNKIISGYRYREDAQAELQMVPPKHKPSIASRKGLDQQGIEISDSKNWMSEYSIHAITITNALEWYLNEIKEYIEDFSKSGINTDKLTIEINNTQTLLENKDYAKMIQILMYYSNHISRLNKCITEIGLNESKQDLIVEDRKVWTTIDFLKQK